MTGPPGNPPARGRRNFRSCASSFGGSARDLESDDEANSLPVQITVGNRLPTAAEFRRLADVPTAVQRFANLTNPSTGRACENASGDCMRFGGIRRPEEFRIMPRTHIIRWRNELTRRGLGGSTIRHPPPHSPRRSNSSARRPPSPTIPSKVSNG